MTWLLQAPLLYPVSKLDGRHTGRMRKRDNLLTGETVRDGGGAKLNDGEKARSSLNHSIISELENTVTISRFVTGSVSNVLNKIEGR
jgi:hypothetical protein